MSATISFKDDKLSNKTTELKPVGTLPGALKYVLKKDLPKAEDKSVMVYTTDTMELFIGGGFGQPLKRVSDIVLVSDVDALPDSGIKEKLYVSAADKAIYFWDDTDGFLQVGGGSGGTAVQTKIMEYPAAGDFPAAGQSKAIYIAKDTDFLYRYDLGTAKYMQLARQTTDPTIAAKFGAIDKALTEKAEKTDLAGYRAVGEPIAEADLDAATAAKLNAIASPPYDDSAIKNRLNVVETDKAGLTYTEATYLKKTDKVSQNQLPTELTDKIGSMEADLDTKASKSEVDAAADSLTKLTTAVNDLTADVNQKADKSEITALQGKLTTAETDLSTAKTNIGTLESTVADLLDRLSALEAANPPKPANSFTHIFSFENPTDTATGILLDDIATGLRFTTDEFYITNDVKLYYLGLEPSREFAANPQYVPTSIQAGEGMAVTSPDGYADFDEDPDVGGKIYFSGGSLGTRVYQVVRE